MQTSKLRFWATFLGIIICVSFAYGLQQKLPSSENSSTLSARISALEKRVNELERTVELLAENKQHTTKAPDKVKTQPKGLPQGYDRDRQKFLEKNPTPLEIDRYNRLHGPRVWKDGAWTDGDEIHYPAKEE